jgi:hypothetical protein
VEIYHHDTLFQNSVTLSPHKWAQVVNKNQAKAAMGKYRNGRRVAVQGGRALLQKVENLVRGGMSPPVWLDAMRECPPPQLPFRCVPACCDRGGTNAQARAGGPAPR